MRSIRPRGFPAVLPVAIAALLLGATPAAALTYDLEFKREPGIAPGFMGPRVVGSVTASNGYCGTNFGSCSFTVKVFRNGALVASGGPGAIARAEVLPQQGDVARVSVGGYELTPVAFDAPVVDNASCAVVGHKAVKGQFGQGTLSVARTRDAKTASANVSTSGDRFTASFGGPMGFNDVVAATSRYSSTTPGTLFGDVTANVAAVWSASVCPNADVNKVLRSSVLPHGKRAKIGALLRRRAYVIKFKAPAAGVALVKWWVLADGRAVAIAKGKRTFHAAGEAKVKVKLTRRGLKKLRHAKRVKVYGQALLTPAAGEAGFANRKFTLRR